MKRRLAFILVLALLLAFTSGCLYTTQYSGSVLNLEEYESSPYIVINNNIPEFTEDDITTSSYEYYSELDRFGRY